MIRARCSAADLTTAAGTQPTLNNFAGAATRPAVGTSCCVTLTDAALTPARVTQADVGASNGVIHVIDKVLNLNPL